MSETVSMEIFRNDPLHKARIGAVTWIAVLLAAMLAVGAMVAAIVLPGTADAVSRMTLVVAAAAMSTTLLVALAQLSQSGRTATPPAALPGSPVIVISREVGAVDVSVSADLVTVRLDGSVPVDAGGSSSRIELDRNRTLRHIE